MLRLRGALLEDPHSGALQPRVRRAAQGQGHQRERVLHAAAGRQGGAGDAAQTSSKTSLLLRFWRLRRLPLWWNADNASQTSTT